MAAKTFNHLPDICVVGGAGHVGLPLSLVFANKGLRVLVYDLNTSIFETVKSGQMPFVERGAEPLLRHALDNELIEFSSDPSRLAGIGTIVVTIGTPVDEFMNPVFKLIRDCVDQLLPYLSDGQLMILRSTVYPGTTEWLDRYIRSHGKTIEVAFCPERVVQGQAIEELQTLPQLVSGTTPQAELLAGQLFSVIAPEVVYLSPKEAEFAKLFNNAHRYIEFAVANQFYMITNSAGVDYHRVMEGMSRNYPRAANIARAGFAAGPCLFKDTMQLAAFSNNQFSLGASAMLVNEGLVLYLVDEIEKKHKLSEMRIGLLGMAFKADSDDTRSSLSYKLKKVLQFRAKEVYTTDPHVSEDPELMPLEQVLAASDLLILCAPHNAYKNLDAGGKEIVDIWGFLKQQSKISVS